MMEMFAKITKEKDGIKRMYFVVPFQYCVYF